MKKIIEWIKKLLGGGSKDDGQDSSSSAFTLIELLIVIAVLGVLAAVVLIAIDPLEQLARGRDSGVKQSVGQLGRAVQSYYTVNQALPLANTSWITTLVNSGEIKIAPSSNVAPGCTGGGIQNNLCYKISGTDFIVYTILESKSENTKPSTCAAGTQRWYAYASGLGRAGTICQAGEPTGNFAGTMY